MKIAATITIWAAIAATQIEINNIPNFLLNEVFLSGLVSIRFVKSASGSSQLKYRVA